MLLFDVGSRRWRIRFLQLVSLIFAGAMAVLAYDVLAEAGEPGGAPRWLSVFGGSFILAVGLAALLGMMLYAARYVTRAERDGETLHIWTLAPLFGERRLWGANGEADAGRRYGGRLQLRQSVHAPWQTLHLPGYRVPFILDMQAPIFDDRALANLGKGPRRSPRKHAKRRA